MSDGVRLRVNTMKIITLLCVLTLSSCASLQEQYKQYQAQFYQPSL